MNPITDELDNHHDAVEEANLSRKRGNEGDLESSMKRLRTAVGSFVTGIFNRKDKISQHFETTPKNHHQTRLMMTTKLALKWILIIK